MSFSDLIETSPESIVCLTEESVEILYRIGKESLISGVSSFVERPEEAKSKPKVSLFTSSKFDEIEKIGPELVLGFSDIQKDIARELIGRGLSVWISNHRSLNEILRYTIQLGRLVGEENKGKDLAKNMIAALDKQKSLVSFSRPPRVYFEEWDSPMISGIQWVSELLEQMGAIDICSQKASGTLARDRFVDWDWVVSQNPDIILACWCGKKVKLDTIRSRKDAEKINAVKNNHIFELPPAVFLQPGPAPFLDGASQLREIFVNWNLM